MRVAVLGSGGMLGGYVSNYLRTLGRYTVVNPTGFDATDITVEDMIKVLRNYPRIDIIINCIGVIKQRNISPRSMIAVNAVFPHTLQLACEILDIKLIHVTTDCVFSGKTGFYTESAEHDASDLYGRSKSLGEPAKATVVRTSIIGSERKRKLSLLEWVKSQDGKECMGYINHTWNGVTCLQLAKYFDYIMKNHEFWEGVRHYHSEDVTKDELVRKIVNVYGLDVKVKEYVAPERRMMTLRSLGQFPSPPTLSTQLDELRIFDEENGLYDRLQRR